VVDATKDLLRLQAGAFQALAWPAAVPAKAFPTSLWFDAGSAMVASFHQGVLLHFGSNAWFTAEHGGGWHAGLRAPGLILIGTDEGLLRVREAGAVEAPEPPPATAALPPFKNVHVKDPVPIGECVPLHGPCGKGLPCCEGTTCSSGFVTTCE
jgi:hypothetical protein